MPEPILNFKVFLSSPGDVGDERSIALEVLRQLPDRPSFRGKITFQVVAWDKPGAGTAMLASMTPQEAIDQGLPRPSECDIVIVILWSRMGRPLQMNGKDYLSGTHYELLDALSNPSTHTLIYHRIEEKLFKASDKEGIAQYDKVQNFFKSELFYDPATGHSRRAISRYNSPADFRELLETNLEEQVVKLLKQHTGQPSSPNSDQPTNTTPTLPTIVAKEWQGSPFPGLRSFTPADARIFFGREHETDALVRLLADNSFVAVVGASGSGKSSLVGAGLLPRLAANAVNSATTASKDWSVVQFKPGQAGHPFAALFEALIETFEPLRPSPFEIRRTKQTFVQDMEGDPATVCDTLKAALTAIKAPRWAEVLLVIDQFEELFTLAPVPTVEPFVKMLDLLAGQERVRLVVTVRHDFIHRAIEIPALAELVRHGFFPLAAPDGLALRRMVKRPAERAGLVFQEGLDDRILSDAGSRAGSLALLAYTLDELYNISARRGDQELNFDDYNGLGGVAGAIGKRAEQTFAGLDGPDEEKERLLGRVFRELVEVDERGTATRRRVSKAHFPPAEQRLVEAFTAARLLITDTDQPLSGQAEQAQVEVAHETLFQSWERLRMWIGSVQEDLILQRQVRRDAEHWATKGRPIFLLWPHERLTLVDAMQKRLEFEPTPTEAAFIEPEQDRLLREIANPTTSHERRRDIGNRLSVIGDTRPGVGVRNGLPDLDWLPVMPGGSIEIGGRTFEVAPFFIARYLVTYTQYEAFVQASDGYNSPKWWEGFPEEYRPQELANQRTLSLNNPRDTISWYGSVAFTRWLDHQLNGLKLALPDGPTLTVGLNAEVRLPLEWEWQWAAQAGPERREYSWGEWRDGYANTSEAGLSRAIAVGMYPQGSATCGALDMSGNLWEWCWNDHNLERTLARQPNKPVNLLNKKTDKGSISTDSKELRGGSFDDFANDAAGAYRNYVLPRRDYSPVGFRVVVAAPTRASDL